MQESIIQLVEEGQELNDKLQQTGGILPIVPSDLRFWRAKVIGTLRREFGAESAELASWRKVEEGFKDPYSIYGTLEMAIAFLIELNFSRPDATPLRSSTMTLPPAGTTGRRIFIVHGHDIANTLRLKELLGNRFSVEPVVLMDQPGQGRTVIEKFEQEAADCAFAFALLTPDDHVLTPSGELTQARPNVVFELGWFYGRLGRKRVVILMKQGTQIHSDLAGIERYEFAVDVREQALKIEPRLFITGSALLGPGIWKDGASL